MIHKSEQSGSTPVSHRNNNYDVDAIRAFYQSKPMSISDLAKKFGICIQTARKAINGLPLYPRTIMSSHFEKVKVYYVYAWYYANTGEIFYVGKGKNGRYLERKAHRNHYFISILNKEGDNAHVKFLLKGLTEANALKNERSLIAKYKKIGWCKANLHEGGCGGNTGNYDNPERSLKISEALKRYDFSGKRNPMYGVHLKVSDETRRKLSIANRGKVISAETREKIRQKTLGRKMTTSHHHNMVRAKSEFVFVVRWDGRPMHVCSGTNRIDNFFRNTMNMSYSLVKKLVAGTYVPKFSRMKFMSHLSLEKIDKAEAKTWLDEMGSDIEHTFFDPPVKSKHVRHASGVVQCDMDGNKIARFCSTKEAALSTGCDATNICKCCRNTYRQHGGFIWKYA